MSIVLRHIGKSYASGPVLRNIDLEIRSGELVALLGPSGSGKTTLLRLIAGMEEADPGSGPILFDGEDISGADIGARRIGFVFQHYALFKHMSVFENVAFGLRAKPWRRRPSQSAITAKVEALLDLVQLSALARRMPSQLSGGQRQRVALARALAVEPHVLLLDEPFGALDATVRRELRRWLRRLHDTIQVTTIFVTHDQEEALEVADRVAVMNAGRIEQFASPLEVYEHPASRFVFQFLGHYNVFSARQQPSAAAGTAALGSIAGTAEPVTLVRPHDVVLRRDDSDGTGIAVRVNYVGLAGPTVKIEVLRLDDNRPIDVEMPLEDGKRLSLAVGDQVFVTVKKQQSFVEDYSI